MIGRGVSFFPFFKYIYLCVCVCVRFCFVFLKRRVVSTMASLSMQQPPRRVLVTGGGSGIGKGICEVLAKRGHNILVTDLNIDSARAVATGIVEAGGRATALELNVASEESVAAAASTVAKDGEGPVHVLVNNAGLQHVANIIDFPPEKFALLIDVMLKGPALLTRAFLSGMREAGYGRIINIGSIHSLVASPYKSAYVAAKHGLVGFSKAIALETGDCDVTCNTICPSYVKTPLVDKQIAQQAKENGISEAEVVEKVMLAPMPKKAFISIDELAGITEFLMGPYAKNISGETISVDGGWTIR